MGFRTGVVIILVSFPRLVLCATEQGAGNESDWSMVLKYCSIPLVSALIGWGTNVIALKMTFYPLEFTGWKVWQPKDSPFGLFGWQGIIPARAAKMAGMAVDMMTEKLFNVEEIFQRLDPEVITELLEPGMNKMMHKIVQEVATEQIPTLWEYLPASIKEEIVIKFLEECPAFLIGFMEEMQSDINEVFDLKYMVILHLTEKKQLLNNVFLECGKQELLFIEKSGFGFGLIFGILQACIWLVWKPWWLLPIAGLICGYATNALALKMIFEPVEPVKFGCCNIQGLFMKRQSEVSKAFAKVNVEQVLNSECFWEAILTGPKVDNFQFMLGRHSHQFCDKISGMLKPIVLMYMGVKEWVYMKDKIADRIMEELPAHVKYLHTYTDEVLAIENELCTKMQELPPAEFEQVLHPVFQEDEFKLILVGAILGLGVGFFQALVVFG